MMFSVLWHHLKYTSKTFSLFLEKLKPLFSYFLFSFSLFLAPSPPRSSHFWVSVFAFTDHNDNDDDTDVAEHPPLPLHTHTRIHFRIRICLRVLPPPSCCSVLQPSSLIFKSNLAALKDMSVHSTTMITMTEMPTSVKILANSIHHFCTLSNQQISFEVRWNCKI